MIIGPPAVRAEKARSHGFGLGVNIRVRSGTDFLQQQFANSCKAGLAIAVGQEPVVADSMETARQYISTSVGSNA